LFEISLKFQLFLILLHSHFFVKNVTICFLPQFKFKSDSGMLLFAQLITWFQTRSRLCPGVPGVFLFDF